MTPSQALGLTPGTKIQNTTVKITAEVKSPPKRFKDGGFQVLCEFNGQEFYLTPLNVGCWKEKTR
jgi:hypothetical protein